MSLRLTANWVPGALIITMMMLSNAVFAQQIEEPVVCPNDNSILDMAYGQHTSGCAINIATDLHRFRLCADVGDDVRFKVESLGSFMDPRLVVRNPAGAIVAEQSCNDNCAFTLPYVVEDAGCHTLFMTDLNTQSTGPYSMQIERYAPANPADLVVSYDEAVSDSINPTTDTDFFQFYGVAGSDVRLTASALD